MIFFVFLFLFFCIRTKYYETEGKLTNMKFSDENAKAQKYLVSLRAENQAPESLSRLFSATGHIWREGVGEVLGFDQDKCSNFEVSQTWALPPDCCVTLSELLHLSEPRYQFQLPTKDPYFKQLFLAD